MPNLCCSSIITSPKFLKITLSSINACVPMTILESPCEIESNKEVLALPFILLLMHDIFTYKPENICSNVL